MTEERHTTKFEGLNLGSGWEEAAGHVDYQLSDPGVSLSKSELGATWRSLGLVTQRSYIVVSVKKSQASPKGKRFLSFAERYMILLRYVYELLWAASSNNLKTKRPPPRGAVKTCVKPLTISEVKSIPSFSTINSDTTATVLPRSSAWYNLTKDDSIKSRRFDNRAVTCTCSPPCRSPRLPISPLARFAPLSTDSLEHSGKEEHGYFERSVGSSYYWNEDLDISAVW